MKETIMTEAIKKTREIFHKKGFRRFISKFKDTRGMRKWAKNNFINADVTIQDFKNLFSEGEVVYGQVFLGGSEISKEKGKRFKMVPVMYSTDKYYDNGFSDINNIPLDIIFGMIYIKENENKVAGGIREVCRYMSKDQLFLNSRISSGLTGGRSVYITCINLDGNLLPYNQLIDNVIPIIVSPNTTKATMVLPKEYWSSEMLLEWSKKKQTQK